MQIAYIYLSSTLVYLSYRYNVEVPIGKNPAPGDHTFNLKLSNVVSIKYRNASFSSPLLRYVLY